MIKLPLYCLAIAAMVSLTNCETYDDDDDDEDRRRPPTTTTTTEETTVRSSNSIVPLSATVETQTTRTY
jgi:hypothetical protein